MLDGWSNGHLKWHCYMKLSLLTSMYVWRETKQEGQYKNKCTEKTMGGSDRHFNSGGRKSIVLLEGFQAIHAPAKIKLPD